MKTVQLQNPILILIIFMMWSGLAGGGEADESVKKGEALASRVTVNEGGEGLFEKMNGKSGAVKFVNVLDTSMDKAYLYHSPWAAGGIALGDLDGNGLLDVYLGGKDGGDELYLQTSSWVFEKVARPGGWGGVEAWTGGVAIVDIDGDRDLDILVSRYDAPLQVYLNDGSGRQFTEAGKQMGLILTDASLMPSFCDYDGDGDLDLFVLTNRYEDPTGKPAKPPVEVVDGETRIREEFEKYYGLKRVGPNRLEADLTGRPNYLFRNEGIGEDGLVKFREVSKSAGLTEVGHGLAAIWWDFNNDGHIDLFVANDFSDPDLLYQNRGDGTFEEVSEKHLPQTAWFSMGADVGDLNGDGLFDLFTTDMAATTHYKAKISMGNMATWRWGLENFWPRQAMRNNLFINSGTGRFLEVAPMAGVSATDWTWGVRMADLDNDGNLDLFFTNGAARYFNNADLPVSAGDGIGKTSWDPFADKEPLREQNLAYRNMGDLVFKEMGSSWGLGEVGVSMGAAQGDLDGDGDLDLVVANLGEEAGFFRNNSVEGNLLKVRLEGKGLNTSGVGAVIRIRTSPGEQVRLMNPWTGFQASSEHAVHFGLGAEDAVENVTVRWPGGELENFGGFLANQLLVLREGKGEKPVPEKPSDEPTFVEVSGEIGLNFKHREKPFDDFSLQPLLPGKLSQLGAGLAVADVNADGWDDVFFAGAAGQSGELYLGEEGGTFRRAKGEFAWEADAPGEGMAPLWFDADGDGDLDLLVTHGSSEFPERSRTQQNRIYRNDSVPGELRFSETAILTLPIYGGASGAAVAFDFDRDGDLDLFLAGRAVPGAWPSTPRSYLLRNESAAGILNFTDVTGEVAPGLLSPGMVTSALASDVDGDGDGDLLLTLEWDAVRVFQNTDGVFEDVSAGTGLLERTGWWNAISSGDYDDDGDIDYLVLNVGLNTKYGNPTTQKPSLIYYGDVDGSGKPHIIEAKTAKDVAKTILPVRGKSCSSNAMPSLRRKFPTFESFAKAGLTDIYEPARLKGARKFEANTFESGLLINESRAGKVSFRWQPLPRMMQTSPGYGAVSADFDADGRLDFAVVQNFYTREPETGIWRGGIGFMMSGGKGGELERANPSQSGFVVDGDGKGLALCDFNRDGWPDVFATQNNGSALAFRNSGRAGKGSLAIQLLGPKGNQQGIGAKVTMQYADGAKRIREIQAGSGYLSQSTATAFLPESNDQGAIARAVLVTWPNGKVTSHEVEGGHQIIRWQE